MEALAKKLGVYLAPGATIKAWSYSTYTQYLQCPLSVALEKVLKIRVEETLNEAMLRGGQLHKAAELYVKAPKKPRAVPTELRSIAEKMEDLRRKKAQAELEWAFDIGWNPVSWFARDAWLRMKVDAMHHQESPPEVDIVDYKTGKSYPEHAQQRSLYGLGGLQLVQLGQLAGGSKDVALRAQHIYTDTGQSATEEFTLKQLPGLKKEWLARTQNMLADTTFKPVPHAARQGSKPYCRWCKFRKSNGGPCPEET